MNKIVLKIGLLFFFFSMIYFVQRNLPLVDIFLRSFIVFIVITVMLSIIMIIFMKSINKASLKKQEELANNLSGK